MQLTLPTKTIFLSSNKNSAVPLALFNAWHILNEASCHLIPWFGNTMYYLIKI